MVHLPDLKRPLLKFSPLYASLFLLVVLVLPGSVGRADTSTVYTYRSPSADGTGKVYMGREIAKTLDHSKAYWLERPEREKKELPDLVVENMELGPTDTVADIGAGSGYFTFRISPFLTQGAVFAVDIQPEMLALIESRKEERGAVNVFTIVGTATDPQLLDTAVHKVLMVDAYHEFSHPREMMEAIVRDLKPGGLVYLIEYREEDPNLPRKALHQMTELQARKEMEAVGLRWIETRDFLSQQHFMVFQKP